MRHIQDDKKIISPLEVYLSSKEKFILNLNNYRNAHYQVINNAKVNYKQEMLKQIKSLPAYKKIMVDYKLFPKTKRKMDIGNVIAIHKKFFEDALVEFKRLPDDDYMHITSSSESFGEVDKNNPRVEILIIDLYSFDKWKEGLED